MERRKTRVVRVGNVLIGGDAPISIQSMTKTDTRDVKLTVYQIKELEEAGCDIIRVAVPDMEAAKVLGNIKKQIKIPLVADIHFDYRLALEAIDQGIDKLRLNPGNIRQMDKIATVVKRANERKIPIRIGVNSGSIDRKRFKEINASSLVASALEHIRILEELGFFDIIISLKATDVYMTMESYQLMATRVDYPFHIGITEAGLLWIGTIKSAIGVGNLLMNGFGDTVRISLTSSPIEEVKVAKEILKVLGLRQFGHEIISCPTCGRCEIDLIDITQNVEKEIALLKIEDSKIFPLKIAVMGCAVNGPGEAKEADIGIAGGKGIGLIFRKGEIIKRVKETELVQELMKEVRILLGEK